AFAHVGPPGLPIRLAIAGVGGWWAYRLANRWLEHHADRMRSPGGTFVVSPGAIETPAGIRITRQQLGRLVVLNSVPQVAEPVFVDAGARYAEIQMGVRHDRIARRSKVARVSYLLRAETGDATTTLAGGMTEWTAHGL